VAAGTYIPVEGNGQNHNIHNSTFFICNSLAIYGGFSGTESNLYDRHWMAQVTILCFGLQGKRSHGDIFL
jgi:hypothetical protein